MSPDRNYFLLLLLLLKLSLGLYFQTSERLRIFKGKKHHFSAVFYTSQKMILARPKTTTTRYINDGTAEAAVVIAIVETLVFIGDYFNIYCNLLPFSLQIISIFIAYFT